MSGRVVVLRGDAARLPLSTASIDAVVCDPPYGLEFMGRGWDAPWRRGDDINADAGFGNVGMADGSNRLPLPSFTGSTNPKCRNCSGSKRGRRDGTAIRKVCTCDNPQFPNHRAEEMRGFQAWCEQWAAECLRVLKPGGYLLAFGGTRTHHRLASGIEDAGFEIRDSLDWIYGSGFPKGKASLKPSHEPIVMARKPALKSAPLPGLDECRTTAGQDYRDKCASVVGLASNRNGDAYGEWTGERADSAHDAGRWPPNVLLSEEAAAEMDRQSGITSETARILNRNGARQMDGWGLAAESKGVVHGDSGGASRFFPVFRYEAKADASERPRLPDGTAWPTVKPVALMRWLVRLVTPPGGTVGDFFCGTGPTGEAAIIEGFDAILLDKDPQAIALTRVRLAKPMQPLMPGLDVPDPGEPARTPSTPKPPPVPDGQDSLFDLPGVA